jgi:hypothetical protein
LRAHSLFCFPSRGIAEKEALTICNPNYEPQRKVFQRFWIWQD